MTLKFNSVLEVVEVHARTKFHQAECSGSSVIVLIEKKTRTKTIQPVASARTVANMGSVYFIYLFIIWFIHTLNHSQ